MSWFVELFLEEKWCLRKVIVSDDSMKNRSEKPVGDGT